MTITDPIALPTEHVALDSNDVKALRLADDHIGFFWDNDPRNWPASAATERPEGGMCYIRAAARVRRSRSSVFTNPDEGQRQERYISLGHRIQDWRLSREERQDPTVVCPPIIACGWNVSVPLSTPEWKTIAAFVKAGDLLTAEWTFGNDTDTVRESGLSRDEFRLEVRRGDRTHTFLLDVEVIGRHSPLRRFTTSQTCPR